MRFPDPHVAMDVFGGTLWRPSWTVTPYDSAGRPLFLECLRPGVGLIWIGYSFAPDEWM